MFLVGFFLSLLFCLTFCLPSNIALRLFLVALVATLACVNKMGFLIILLFLFPPAAPALISFLFWQSRTTEYSSSFPLFYSISSVRSAYVGPFLFVVLLRIPPFKTFLPATRFVIDIL